MNARINIHVVVIQEVAQDYWGKNSKKRDIKYAIENKKPRGEKEKEKEKPSKKEILAIQRHRAKNGDK